MFEKALLAKDREEFIDLFLSQGVRVHKFLNHKKYKLLFEKAEDREFFINICLEGVLGISEVECFGHFKIFCVRISMLLGFSEAHETFLCFFSNLLNTK